MERQKKIGGNGRKADAKKVMAQKGPINNKKERELVRLL